MSRQLERLLKLDELLRRPGRHTADSLAAELEVSDRTIRSDLAFLRDRYHAPLGCSRRQGYHYTDSEWRLPHIPLTAGELFALTLGAQMLETYSGSTYAPQLRSALARLSERLPEQTWLDLQSVAHERVSIHGGAELSFDPEIWQGVEEACQSSRQISIRYRTASRGDQVSERVVDPYVLHIYRGTNPYLIGYCHKRQEVRWFRVDRILELKPLSQKFQIDPTFNLQDHLEMIFQHEVGGIPETVEIWFDATTAPFIRERRWHPTQEIQSYPDGSLTLVMTVRGMNDVKRWILGYGQGAQILKPPNLVAMVKEELRGMVRRYGEV